MARKLATQPRFPDPNIEAQAAALDPKAERRRQKEEAKRAKREARQKGKTKARGRGGLAAVILIPLILVGVVVAILAFNPLNLRDGAFAPVLLNVPVLRDFVQQPELAYGYEIAELTPSQLQAEVASLTAEVGVLENEIARLTQLNDVHMRTNFELENRVMAQDVLESNREAFEREAATAAPETFMSWFQEFDPERAAAIFAEIVYNDAREQEYRAYIASILAMEESAVAEAFEEMIPVNTEFVVAIMRRLNAGFAGEVLSEMSARNSALIIRQMYPGDFFDGNAVEVE